MTIQDNTTLNHDINLIERENGYWDYEFQYGDIVQSKNNQSLRNALIIACLTSWNYLNRQGNPTYSEFGNKSYWELKKRKSTMVEYTIKQYFIEVLNRIRRVHRIVDIQVLDHPTDPNAYNVAFTVESINDEIVNASFNIGTNPKKSSTHLNITSYGETASPNNPAYVKAEVETEYGTLLENEIVFMYRQKNDETEEYIGAYIAGSMIPVHPFDSFGYERLLFKYNGNSLFNGSTDDGTTVLSVPFHFTIDQNNHLQMHKATGYDVKAWLGKIVETLEERTDTNLIYLVKTSGDDYDKWEWDDGLWLKTQASVYENINRPEDITTGDLRLFIEDPDGKLHIIENLTMENSHVYYGL